MRARWLTPIALCAACATGSGADGVDTGSDTDTGTDTDVPGPDAETRVDADVTPVPDAAPGAPDAAPVVGDPDTCAQAIDLTAGAGGAGGVTVSGNTTGYANDTEPANTCTGYIPDGPDAVYTVDALAGETIVATLVPNAWDASLFISSNCTFNAACLVGADAGAPTETVSWTAQTSATYYVVVESWDVASFGAYELTVELQ